MKLLAWDGSGMWLEQGRFIWPPIRDGAVYLTTTQLSMLLDGLNWTCVAPKAVKQPVREIEGIKIFLEHQGNTCIV